jgi:hypothetical protein
MLRRGGARQRQRPHRHGAEPLERQPLAVDRDAFHALFTNLPPLRSFFERQIEARNR